MPHCFVVGCSNNTRLLVGPSYHSFPRDARLRKQWLKLIGRNTDLMIIHERVCSDHFHKEDIKFNGSRRYLTPNSMPVKKLPLSQNTQSDDDDDEEENVSELSAEVKSKVRRINASNFGLTVNDDKSTGLISEQENKKALKKIIKVTILNNTVDSSEETAICKNENTSSLNQITLELSNRFNISSNATRMIQSTFSFISLDLMNDGKQIHSSSIELKKFAMTLLFHNYRAYEYVLKTHNLGLPVLSTVREWMLKTDFSPGFTKPAIDMLRIRAHEYREKTGGQQLCGCLLLNEISLKREVVCEESTGNLWGYVDIGANAITNNEQDLAEHAFVLMVVGVNDCFKIPIAYFFIKSITEEERTNIIYETLRHLNSVDIKLLSVTCEGPQVYFKMMEQLGCVINDVDNLKTFFLHPANAARIYIMFDISHMIKLIKSNWCAARVFFDLDGNEIKWEFIEKLCKIHKEKRAYFKKLGVQHIKWENFIMKLKEPPQTLSNNVASTLEFLCKDCHLEEFKKVLPTVNFIRRINNLFDLMNSRNPFATGMNTALREENEHYWRPVLSESITYIKSLRLSTGSYLHLSSLRVPFIGLLATIQSFLDIYDEEVKSTSSLKYLLAYKFSQDNLYQFFSSIRKRNDLNKILNCLQFYRAYKRLVLNKIPSLENNCRNEENSRFLEIGHLAKKENNGES